MSLDMRSTLIDVATGQVRRLGYSAFSYADLAAAVGIRKPSIHHHFPAKEISASRSSPHIRSISRNNSLVSMPRPAI